MTYRRLMGVGALAMLASACQNMQALVRHESLPGGGGALLVDARSRAIVSGQEPTRGAPATSAARDHIVCAEPSPDAISALAMGIAGSAQNERVGAASGSISVTESAASIGLRTQSIQLLRDGMYRLCESYMNGAISAPQYVILWNRYQEMMVGLVAIEQLTGVQRAPAVSIGSEAMALSSQTQQTLLIEQRRLEQLRTEKSDADRRLADLQRTGRNPAATPEQLEQAQEDANTAKSAYDSQDAYVRQLRETSTTATQQANQQMALSTAGSTHGRIEQRDGANSNLSDDNATSVANAIDNITRRLTVNNFLAMSCMPVLERALLRADGSEAEVATLAEPNQTDQNVENDCRRVAAQIIAAELAQAQSHQ